MVEPTRELSPTTSGGYTGNMMFKEINCVLSCIGDEGKHLVQVAQGLYTFHCLTIPYFTVVTIAY